MRSLGDDSVVYRAAGLYAGDRGLISARSRLRKRMMDQLHAGGVEIVSPSFVNRRDIDPAEAVMPPRVFGEAAPEDEGGPPEELIFDKADREASLERLRELLAEANTQLDEARAEKEPARAARLEKRGAALREEIARREEG